MKKSIFTVLFIIFIGTLAVKAQYYTYGQDPFSVKWRQLKGENFRIIYPENIHEEAIGVLEFLEAIQQPLSQSLQSNPRPIPVVLRNQTMLSNGFVTWAPKRIEMITTAPADNLAVDWMKYLSVHEFRHVVQVEGINRSSSGFLSRLFGQHFTGAVAGLHLPLWFLEGDAVLAETSFSLAGRGRQPSFIMPLTAQLIEKGAYNYDKASMGSYRDIVPNYYVLGYHLVASIQQNHGFDPFQQALMQVSRTPWLPGSFSRGVKKVTGSSLSANYNSVMNNLGEVWKEMLEQAPISSYETINPSERTAYSSYIQPWYVNADEVVAFKTSPSQRPQLVKINSDGEERVLFSPGFGYYNTLSVAGQKAAWIEIQPDPRWEYRVWTNIRLLDLKSLKSSKLTTRGRLQSAKLSPDGRMVSAVQIDETNRWSLLVFDIDSSSEIFSFTDAGIHFLQEPAWADDSKHIVAVAFIEDKGKSLIRIAMDKPGFETLLETGYTGISRPVVKNDIIFFSAAWTGRDEIYAYQTNDRRLYHVLSSKYGAYPVSFNEDGSKMLFSDYRADGFQIAEATNLIFREFDPNDTDDLSLHLYAAAAREENFLIEEAYIPEREFKSKPYRKLLNQLHFHSWIPSAMDVDGLMLNPGLTVFSQDLLGTTVLAAGYEYDQTMNGHKFFADYSLMALYPKIDVRLETGFEDRLYLGRERDTLRLRTDVFKAIAGISLPLSFNHHSLIWGVIPRLSTSQEIYAYSYESETYRRGRRQLSYRFSAYAYQRMAMRDLYPRLGASFTAGYSHTPFRNTTSFNDINAGSIRFVSGGIFLPGLGRHHSLRLTAGAQQKAFGQTYFGDAIRFARGYLPYLNTSLCLFSVGYAFPLWYPDLSAGSLIYTKRLRANLFFDQSISRFDLNKTNLRSYGVDLLIDAHLLRLPMPFEFGLRTLYRENMNDFRMELIWGVDFYALTQNLRSPIPAFRF